jgi:energy-coupling factor transporter ATP-binding protein EcfA2
MSDRLHPSLLQHYLDTNKRANQTSFWLVVIAWGCIAAASMTSNLPTRIGCLSIALGVSIAAKPIRKSAIATERVRNDIDDISTQSFQNWLWDAMKPSEKAVEVALPIAQLPQEVYPFDSLLDEAVGIALLGNSGSGKSSVAKYLAGLMGLSQVLVLDPHDDGNTWDGLPVISDYESITVQLQLLLDELDDRRVRRKAGEKLEPLVVICDEFPAVRDYCQQVGMKVADRFILRFGSECRKFNILTIFCSQSGNTKSLGLEGKGDFLENYVLVRLCKVAVKHAKNLSDRTVLARLQSVGFPCLVGDEVSIHPTHGKYQKFAKGLPPKGLKPLRSLPLTIPLAGSSEVQANVQGSAGSNRGSSPRTQLERAWELDLEDSGSKGSAGSNGGSSPNFGGFSEGSDEPEPFSEIDEMEDETLRQLIIDFRSEGITSQDGFIHACWGVSKGGGRKYHRARERYQEVCRRFGL